MSSRTEHARQKINQEQKAEQAAQAYELRIAGASMREIAAQLGIALGTVHERLQHHVAGYVDPLAAQYRQIELDRLDAALPRYNRLERAALQVLERNHVTVSDGRVVLHNDEPLLDDGPVLAAIDRLVKIEEGRRRNSERRAKLLGLDAPVKADVTVTPVDPADIELRQMLDEARAKAAAEEAALKGGALS